MSVREKPAKNGPIHQRLIRAVLIVPIRIGRWMT